MKHRETTPARRLRSTEDEGSGVHLRVSWRGVTAPEWGHWGEELARRLVDELGARVMLRFPRLTDPDVARVLARVKDRLVRSGPPSSGAIEAHVRRAVFCEALPVDRARFAEEIRTSEGDLDRLLEGARRRLSSLTARERSVLVAVFTLDHVAEEDEVGKVVLHAAVAYQMRWNTAHQNLSRAWRKLAEGKLAGVEWRAAHRFICEPPSFELWTAARAYLDACSGRGAHGGPAFAAWTRAHEDHNGWFNEWKKQSTAAAQQWRAFAGLLEASGVTPGDVAGSLIAECQVLGIDRWLIPAKVRQQSWRNLLREAPRPSADARAVWRDLLRSNPFGAEVEAAFRALEREAALAEVAGVELEAAYNRLLTAAEGRSRDGVQAKDDLHLRLEAARWA